MPLISADEPLPPRGDMYEYFAPDSRELKTNSPMEKFIVFLKES
jgi:hypothetical protein